MCAGADEVGLQSAEMSRRVHGSQLFIKEESLKMGTKIGQGGFGHVYRGRLFGFTDVACKMSKRPMDAHLMSEVRILRKLRHANIVTLVGVTMWQDNLCIVVVSYVEDCVILF